MKTRYLDICGCFSKCNSSNTKLEKKTKQNKKSLVEKVAAWKVTIGIIKFATGNEEIVESLFHRKFLILFSTFFSLVHNLREKPH